MLKKIIKFLVDLFSIECPECKTNTVGHSHAERIGIVWKEIYECRKCGRKFI